MIISVTERGVFRRCKQQWDYSSFNRQGLTSVLPPTALSLGGLVHKCHEEWLLHPDEPVEEVAIRVCAQGAKDLKERYTKAVGVEPDEREMQGFWDQAILVMEMMVNYKSMWGSALPDGYTLLQPEQTIVVPIPGTEHACPNPTHNSRIPKLDELCAECQGTKRIFHYLEGTLDALMRDSGERVWVLERKTYGNHPRENVLQQNDQFLAYLWLLSQIDVGELGGVFYDGMWKRKLEGKRTLEELFTRIPLIRSPEEIKNFGVQVRDEALDMAQPDLRIYRNRAWTGCWDCQFDPLCSAEFREEDAAYIRERKYVSRTRHDWLEEAAAD